MISLQTLQMEYGVRLALCQKYTARYILGGGWAVELPRGGRCEDFTESAPGKAPQEASECLQLEPSTISS